jgi:hypothetical protein
VEYVRTRIAGTTPTFVPPGAILFLQISTPVDRLVSKDGRPCSRNEQNTDFITEYPTAEYRDLFGHPLTVADSNKSTAMSKGPMVIPRTTLLLFLAMMRMYRLPPEIIEAESPD